MEQNLYFSLRCMGGFLTFTGKLIISLSQSEVCRESKKMSVDTHYMQERKISEKLDSAIE